MLPFIVHSFNIIMVAQNVFFHTDKPVFLSYMEGDPVDLYVFQSDSVNLTCHNSAEPAANMTWSFNGKFFTNPADHYIVRIILHNLYNSLLPWTWCTVCDRKNIIPIVCRLPSIHTKMCSSRSEWDDNRRLCNDLEGRRSPVA